MLPKAGPTAHWFCIDHCFGLRQRAERHNAAERGVSDRRCHLPDDRPHVMICVGSALLSSGLMGSMSVRPSPLS